MPIYCISKRVENKCSVSSFYFLSLQLYTMINKDLKKTYAAEDHDVAEILFRENNSRPDHGFLNTPDFLTDLVHVREFCWVPDQLFGSVAVLDSVGHCWCRNNNICVIFLYYFFRNALSLISFTCVIRYAFKKKKINNQVPVKT